MKWTITILCVLFLGIAQVNAQSKKSNNNKHQLKEAAQKAEKPSATEKKLEMPDTKSTPTTPAPTQQATQPTQPAQPATQPKVEKKKPMEATEQGGNTEKVPQGELKKKLRKKQPTEIKK